MKNVFFIAMLMLGVMSNVNGQTTSLGLNAGTAGTTPPTTWSNTNIGKMAGQFATGTAESTNIGDSAGQHNTGINNVFLGNNAGWGSGSSTLNVFLGMMQVKNIMVTAVS